MSLIVCIYSVFKYFSLLILLGKNGATMLDASRHAWRGSELVPEAGRFDLPKEVAEELIIAVQEHTRSGLQIVEAKVTEFELSETSHFISRISEELKDGVGFVLIDRLPLDLLGEKGARTAYWILCSLIERPVAQNWVGDLVYDVTDTGRPPGNGVRPDKTNAEQNFHTDNSYNLCPPNYVSLLCLRAAKRGGISHIVSLEAAHEALRHKRPDLLERLYRPFYFDRQREHASDDVMTTYHPLFAVEKDRLLARLSRFQVTNGHKLAGTTIDALGVEALDALEAQMNAPGMDVSFTFEPGQVQILDNRRIGHRRTGFEDWAEPNLKRLLVRLWLRDWGTRDYHGGLDL